MAVLGVHYEEGKGTEGYKTVYLFLDGAAIDGRPKLFHQEGNTFYQDLQDALAVVPSGESVSFSSTVDFYVGKEDESVAWIEDPLLGDVIVPVERLWLKN